MEGDRDLDEEHRDLGQEAAWSLSSAKQGNGALGIKSSSLKGEWASFSK